jgi:hypothetical protein
MIEELAGNSGAYWGIREIIEKEIQEISIATQHSVTEHQGEKISIFSYFQRRTVLWQPVMEFPLQWTLPEVNFETTAVHHGATQDGAAPRFAHPEGSLITLCGAWKLWDHQHGGGP